MDCHYDHDNPDQYNPYRRPNGEVKPHQGSQSDFNNTKSKNLNKHSNNK
jgi:hypothetical protein